MKILISPIGNSDPHSPDGKEGAALTICRYLEPDMVYLLPTEERPDVKDSTHSNAQKTEEEIEGISPDAKVYIRPLDVKDPTDFSQLLPQFKDILTRILEETKFCPQRDFYFNATSATSEIQASCIAAVTSGLITAKVLQVADPKYSSGRERVREVSVTLFQENGVLDKVNRLYERLIFDACAEELKSLEQLTQSRLRRDGAEIWCLLCEGYSALDRLDYIESRGYMSKLISRIEHTYQFQPVEDLLNEQLSTLKELSGSSEKNEENELILTDIYHNARRCLAREACADALGRVWRLLEGGMFYYLRENYGIEPTKLDKSPCLKSSDASSLVCGVVAKLTAEGKQYLSFESSRIALQEELSDKAFCDLLAGKTVRGEVRKLMDGLREVRNKSVVAHGIRPVGKEVAQSGLGLAEHFLRFLFPELDLEQYPFAQENLYRVGEGIRKVI